MKMKKFTFLFALLMTSQFVFAQNFTFYFDTDTTLQNNSIGQLVDFKGHVINHTNATMVSHWDISETNFPHSSWIAFVCDDNQCYSEFVADRTQDLAAGDTGLVKVTITAGTNGVGSLVAKVYDNADTSVVQQYTLTLDATTSTHTLASVVVFSQNAPNPFYDYTLVKYDLKGNNGQIILTDISGRQIRNYDLNASAGEVVIGQELSSGLYFYSLVVDGRIVTTKRLQKL